MCPPKRLKLWDAHVGACPTHKYFWPWCVPPINKYLRFAVQLRPHLQFLNVLSLAFRREEKACCRMLQRSLAWQAHL